jgi:hypothetical protein
VASQVRFNETTGTYFQARRDFAAGRREMPQPCCPRQVQKAADDWLLENEPRHK